MDSSDGGIEPLLKIDNDKSNPKSNNTKLKINSTKDQSTPHSKSRNVKKNKSSNQKSGKVKIVKLYHSDKDTTATKKKQLKKPKSKPNQVFKKGFTPSTSDYVDYGSAGGIIIDPWNNPSLPEKYNIFVIKQRATGVWGLPKGHLEKDEELEEGAMREVLEETGYNLSSLQEGTDFISVPLNNTMSYCNKIKTHQIHLFIWVLLKPGKQVRKSYRDFKEIEDSAWLNTTRLRKLNSKRDSKFLCNRTINPKILFYIDKACQKSFQLLQKHHSYFTDTSETTETPETV